MRNHRLLYNVFFSSTILICNLDIDLYYRTLCYFVNYYNEMPVFLFVCKIQTSCTKVKFHLLTVNVQKKKKNVICIEQSFPNKSIKNNSIKQYIL